MACQQDQAIWCKAELRGQAIEAPDPVHVPKCTLAGSWRLDWLLSAPVHCELAPGSTAGHTEQSGASWPTVTFWPQPSLGRPALGQGRPCAGRTATAANAAGAHQPPPPMGSPPYPAWARALAPPPASAGVGTPPVLRPGTGEPAGGLDSLDLLLGGGEGTVAGAPPSPAAAAARWVRGVSETRLSQSLARA